MILLNVCWFLVCDYVGSVFLSSLVCPRIVSSQSVIWSNWELVSFHGLSFRLFVMLRNYSYSISLFIPLIARIVISCEHLEIQSLFPAAVSAFRIPLLGHRNLGGALHPDRCLPHWRSTHLPRTGSGCSDHQVQRTGWGVDWFTAREAYVPSSLIIIAHMHIYTVIYILWIVHRR